MSNELFYYIVFIKIRKEKPTNHLLMIYVGQLGQNLKGDTGRQKKTIALNVSYVPKD